ncbi:deubiquitinating enzyme [Ancistrocladus abbreviatus]
MPTVSVKWRKEVFPSVEINTSQPPYVFNCQLYKLTGVPPDRKKIMVKGGLLKQLGVKEVNGVLLPKDRFCSAAVVIPAEFVVSIIHSAGSMVNDDGNSG